ncbi:cytochrome P450 monooxygenase [Fonsecaea pedrosoi]|nr:cytochrome P450 monooxygenase [Fonsecaea pedrosoi]
MLLTPFSVFVVAPALALLSGILIVLYQWVDVLIRRRRLPPGPFPFPLVGNLFQLPREKQWCKLEEWSKVYNSPIITYWEGCKATIVCNDAWTISELNDRRANIYSSRPYKTVTGKLFGLYDMNQAGLPYGDRWRLHRRLTHAATNASIVHNYQPFQGQEAKILVNDCLERPESFVDAVDRYTVSVVSTIAWGRRIRAYDDPVLRVAQAFVGSSSLALPGRCWTEAIPILADMPNCLNTLPAMMKTLATSSNKYFYALCEEGAKQPEDNFAKRLIREGEDGLGRVDIANLTGNFMGAGVDTTSSSLLSCILAMCLFPDVQAKAHAELDRVVGQDRSPTWSDENQLEFIYALVQETLRWRPVFPLGGPQHCPIQDDEYQGYRIPKGTPILGNLYAINRNPREYPEPLEFRPERFIGDLERPYPNKKGHNVFGWGRRVCSGESLAQQSLFFTIACLLWAFEIRPGLDDNGKELKLDPEAYNNMQVNRPLPFKARFIPRSEKIAKIIKDDAAAATEFLKKYDGETKVTKENAQSVVLEAVTPAIEKA